MEQIIKQRCAGKTYDLIHLSAKTQYPILCANSYSAEEIIKEAKNIGANIPQPLSNLDMISTRGKNISNVLVDELDCICNDILNKNYNINIHGYTLTDNSSQSILQNLLNQTIENLQQAIQDYSNCIAVNKYNGYNVGLNILKNIDYLIKQIEQLQNFLKIKE